MRLEIHVMSSSVLVDKYVCSLSEFSYNEKELNVENKLLEFMHLTSMVSGWENTELNDVVDGFKIFVDIGDYSNKYVFDGGNLPNNFMTFMHEIKRLNMEV